MTYNKSELGARIKLLRKQHGLTQEQFSEMLNMTENNLYRMESGRRNISIELLVEISTRFNTSLDYLVFGKTANVDQEKVRAAMRLLSEIVEP